MYHAKAHTKKVCGSRVDKKKGALKHPTTPPAPPSLSQAPNPPQSDAPKSHRRQKMIRLLLLPHQFSGSVVLLQTKPKTNNSQNDRQIQL